MNAINTSDLHEWFNRNATYSFLRQIDDKSVRVSTNLFQLNQWHDEMDSKSKYMYRVQNGHAQDTHVLNFADGAKNQNLIRFHFTHELVLIAHACYGAKTKQKMIVFWPVAIARLQQIYCRSTIRCHTCRDFSTCAHVIITYRRSMHKSNIWWALIMYLNAPAQTRTTSRWVDEPNCTFCHWKDLFSCLFRCWSKYFPHKYTSKRALARNGNYECTYFFSPTTKLITLEPIKMRFACAKWQGPVQRAENRA